MSARGSRPGALAARTRAAIRRFFADRGYEELQTPVRLPTPALELHIDAVPAGAQFLRTSPELCLKRAIAAGHERVYELGCCFRAGEHGPRHREQFTMLEWYCAGADYRDALNETRELMLSVAQAVLGASRLNWGGATVDLSAEWAVWPVRDAYLQHAGWDPCTDYDGDRFDRDAIERIEPALPRDRPAVLMDYPAEAAALARVRPAEPPVAERWELFVAGLELANAYSELTDPVEQRARFEACAADRTALGKAVYPLDEAFLAALERGLPDCAGVALGFDRLLMLLTGAPDIADVLPFEG